MTLGTPYPDADPELPSLAAYPSIKLLEDRSAEKEATEKSFQDEMFEALLFADESAQDKQTTKDSEKRAVGSSRRAGADGKIKVFHIAGSRCGDHLGIEQLLSLGAAL